MTPKTRWLLDSQLATLEDPSNALTLDAAMSVDAIVAAIRQAFEL